MKESRDIDTAVEKKLTDEVIKSETVSNVSPSQSPSVDVEASTTV